MKKTNILTLTLFFFSTFILSAVVLPEGTDARISDIAMDDEGHIQRVVLSTPQEINTPIGKIVANGEVKFNNEGKVVEFTPEYEGTVTTAIGAFNYASNRSIDFYDSGCIKSMYLLSESTLEINGTAFPCYPYLISFYDNWKPFLFVLSKDTSVSLPCGNVVLAGRNLVTFNEEGNLLIFELASPALLTTKAGSFKAEDSLLLYADGTPIRTTVNDAVSGLTTKYGKVFPAKGSPIYFYENGEINQVTPQDMTIIKYEGLSLLALANKELYFDMDGTIHSATVRGKKISLFGWSLEFATDDFQFVIYPNNKIYFPNVFLSSINGKTYYYNPYNENQKKLLVDEENCYYWDAILKNEGSSWSPKYHSSVYKLSKDDLTETLVVKIEDGTPSNFTEDGYFDYENCPLIFSEDDELIGYRKATTKPEDWDPVTDHYLFDERYNKKTKEFENYREDVHF